MTIKRRLFISNILMLIVPVMLTALAAGVFVLIYMNVSGAGDWNALTARNNFNQAVYQVNALSEKWTPATGRTEIRKDVDLFHKGIHSSAALYIYTGNEPLFEDLSITDADMLEACLAQENNTIIISGGGAVYSRQAGEYKLILLDTSYTVAGLQSGAQDINNGIFIFAAVIIAVMFTSWLLTKFVFRGIVRPLNILAKGVHEIRDGNLSYRISYEGKDEFAAVTADFNEMAKQLSESVGRRQKDEANRKELIAGISHDLRTPLTSIKAYIEGIEKGVASTPRLQKKYFDTIKAKTNELEQIINQLFIFSKLDIGEFPFRLEKVDIVGITDEFIRAAEQDYENNGLSIEFAPSNEKIYVELDVIQFHNILTNILENSLKYKVKEKAKIEISYRKENSAAVLRFEDDGEGVPEESLNKLFDVFYRCDPSRNNKNSGSGLGLAITAKILERLHGTIRAENAGGGGLAIIITLPATE